MEKTMALDGIVIANITNELNKILTGGRITKIAQPEKEFSYAQVAFNLSHYCVMLIVVL